ncbi:MAG: class I SAM-dependent methyltransferase [Candidatus Bathyarchaeota archaeon]|nr:class I SAM-dependent methyltransferase [Candidatus Bathyarchaeota archaeon]
MKNAFGLEMPEIKDIVTDKKVNETISSMLFPVLTYLGIPSKKATEIITNCLQVASNYRTLAEYEGQAHDILAEEQVAARIPEKLLARADLMYSQIERYLLPGNVLDYGCGDGRVAELIAKHRKQELTLADVYEHKHVKETGLRFELFEQGASMPFDEAEFDNTLALTVYHHSSTPLDSVKDTCRVTKPNGRLLVIESVYGVDGKELPAAMQEKITRYLSLTPEQQMKANTFFDHFYNRVIHYSKNSDTKVNVPFNFNTPENWEKLFTKCGLKQETIIHLGLDQPTAPEYHTLYILRKI